MRFVYDGEPPAVTPILLPNVGAVEDEKLLVNPTNRGIKNVVVYVYTGRGGTELPEFHPRNEVVTLTANNLKFSPHVLLARVGDMLKIENQQPVGISANLNFSRNQPAIWMVRPGKANSLILKQPEPVMMPVDDNIHPWMRAYLVVMEHPFVAASDENGDLYIRGLPVGKELVFAVRHEFGKFEEVRVDGIAEVWRRKRFSLMLEPGQNDLGDVLIPRGAFE